MAVAYQLLRESGGDWSFISSFVCFVPFDIFVGCFSIVFIVICARPTTKVLVGSRCLVAHGFARVVVFVVPLRGSQKHVVAELSGDVLNLLIIFCGYGQGSLFT